MPSEATGGALSGAANGAAAGSAFGPWGTAIGAVVGGVGGYLTASGTAQSQKEANKVAAQGAAAQSAQQFFNYLASRGIDLQQVARANPAYEQEYTRVRGLGDKRDFQTWLYDHLKSSPGDSLWDAIADPAGSGAAANTTLPAWAVDANGNPLQPALLQQLLGINGGPANPATVPIGSVATLANAHALLTANPEIAAELAAVGVGDDGRTPEQWLVDHVTTSEAASGGGRFTDYFRNFAATGSAVAPGGTLENPGSPVAPGAATPAPGTSGAPAGPAGTGNPTTLDPAIAAIIPQATSTLSGVFDGTYLNQVLGGLEPIANARDAAAAAQLARVNELRGLSGNVMDTELAGLTGVLSSRTAGAGGIYDASVAAANKVNDANISKLAELLGVRREAAEQIYNASLSAAGGVRDARTTGAKGIYDAESLRADTFEQSAKQALARVLSQQTAERARRGFTGGSSGSDLTRARLMSDYLQRGAGERATAGVNYQGRLSDAGIGFATDTGAAGMNRATNVGRANEADATAKLTAAVELARSLGIAGVNKATTLAGAGEQDAIAQLQARVADATRRLGYLTSDADLAKANADLANAQDQLTALLNDQNRKVGAVGAPFNLAGLDLALKGSLNDQKYSDIDALMKRLQPFMLTQASGPALTTAAQGSVLNGSQIAGGALSGIGSAIGNSSSNQQLADLIKLLSATSSDRSGIGAQTTYADFLKANPTSSAASGLTPIFTPGG